MNITAIYHPDMPDFVSGCLQAPELQRLRDIGMNCGCEYTHFPRFVNLGSYSRYDHSLGCALIVWHFTGSPAQTLAALFHDIATPVFAHSVDFLNGDYLTQESTEAGTAELIDRSPVLQAVLCRLSLATKDAGDYHRWPVADNDAPRLSADRLEYTLGNLLNFGFLTLPEVKALYDDLTLAENEEGLPELCFTHRQAAEDFAAGALRCARVYVSDEDRYAMQRLAEVLRDALEAGVLRREDLMTTESRVIGLLEARPETVRAWEAFRRLHRMVPPETAPAQARVIVAKRRYIDPLVLGKGRLSRLDDACRSALETFLTQPMDAPVCAE